MSRYQTVEINGIRTAYIDAGAAGNEVVLLIHDGAYGATAELCWGEVIDQLAEKYRVIAPDLLGWGSTAKIVHFDELPYPPRIRHVASLLSYLGIEECYCAGTSFGGSLAVRAAIDPTDPWNIKKVISITGAGGLYRYPEGVEELSRFEPSMEEARRLTALLVDNVEAFEDHIKSRYENSLIPGHWEAMAAPRLRNPATERVRFPDPFPEALRDTAIPILFIEGAADKLLEPGWASALAAMAPQGSSLVLDCGHEPNIEMPAELSRTMDLFFRGGDSR